MRAFPNWNILDFSACGWNRVIVVTVVGSICCVALALIIDSYSFNDGWRLGANPINDVIIPLLIAPPFFFYLLSKLRQLAVANDQLMIVASTDGLTSCLNRVAFTTLVDAYLERVDRQELHREGALLIMDVDHFKSVNDSFGHDAGDEALKLIVQSVRSTLRDIDLVGRMGGEEFSVFLPGTSADRAYVVAERIRKTVEAADFSPEGAPYGLSISIGGVTYISRTSFSELYKLADKRLYEAKRNGRNRAEFCRLNSRTQLTFAH